MDVSILNGVSSDYLTQFAQNQSLVTAEEDSFSTVLDAAMNMVNETNDLQNLAAQEEIRFALGEAENTHDMVVAETKALTALQYTVAIRDKAIEAYKEIMNIQV